MKVKDKLHVGLMHILFCRIFYYRKKAKLLSILLEQIEKHNAWVDSSIEKIRKEHCTQTDFIYYRQHFHGKKYIVYNQH